MFRGPGGGEEVARVQIRIAEILVHRAVEMVGPRLQNEVRRALAAVHHRRAGRLQLELLHRFRRNAQRNVSHLALNRRVGDRHSFEVHLARVALCAGDVAEAVRPGIRRHSRHQAGERRGVAWSVAHKQRQRHVDIVPHRLPDTRIHRVQLRRRIDHRDLFARGPHF